MLQLHTARHDTDAALRLGCAMPGPRLDMIYTEYLTSPQSQVSTFWCRSLTHRTPVCPTSSSFHRMVALLSPPHSAGLLISASTFSLQVQH